MAEGQPEKADTTIRIWLDTKDTLDEQISRIQLEIKGKRPTQPEVVAAWAALCDWQTVASYLRHARAAS